MDVIIMISIGPWSQDRGKAVAGSSPYLLAERAGHRRIGQLYRLVFLKTDGANVNRVCLGMFGWFSRSDAVASSTFKRTNSRKGSNLSYRLGCGRPDIVPNPLSKGFQPFRSGEWREEQLPPWSGRTFSRAPGAQVR